MIFICLKNNKRLSHTYLTWYFVGFVLVILHLIILASIELYRKRKNKLNKVNQDTKT